MIYLEKAAAWGRRILSRLISPNGDGVSGRGHGATGDMIVFGAKSVREQVAEGADVNARNSDGRTALYLAAVCDFLDDAEVLLAAGAEVDPIDPLGRTPLCDAVVYGHSQIVKVLLAAGANVNTGDSPDNIPLMIACQHGWSDESANIVQALLAAGAEVNRQCATGETPLSLAVERGHTNIMPLLLDAGADIEAIGEIHLIKSDAVKALLIKAGAKNK